ncbi:hypothetical protein AURDEDRAFT_186651 [Auricularia subglabra TFB-10046 SS5]|nr:hypothetical protein AURDEDRAFT_186651 [Auricularia subglabra TFB-10046 SS5]
MTSLNRLAIRGIRSFDDKQLSVIEFFSPITVIVGHDDSSVVVPQSRIDLELLSELHQRGRVPGLVRPSELKPIEPDRTAEEMEAAAQTKLTAPEHRTIYHPSMNFDDDAKSGLGRVKEEVLHLGSIGQPLSQCKTTGDLLRVMYDLIKVHDHVVELRILHRDLSWFNVMCNPKHLIKEHPLLKTDTSLSRPCINQILGEPDAEPCVLLADFDHAIKLDGSEAPQPDEKTGTPMFISVEVSTPKSMKYRPVGLAWIKTALLQAENDATAFNLAFPKGDGDFMRNFERVMQLEDERMAKSNYTARPHPTRHGSRHDAESNYWIFLWAFARARPLLAALDTNKKDLNKFCNDMFSHGIGRDTGEAGRAPWLLHGEQIQDLFHPSLQVFEPLFIQMSNYLAIPWYLYCGGTDPDGNRMLEIMKPNHVHVAFRRIVLAFFLDPRHADALETALDAQAPRSTSKYS